MEKNYTAMTNKEFLQYWYEEFAEYDIKTDYEKFLMESIYDKIESIKNPDIIIESDKLPEFWGEIYEDGMTIEDVNNELKDFEYMIEQVPKVYMEVTGGLLSKPNYPADTVIQEYYKYIELRYTESIIDDFKESEDYVELLEDYLHFRNVLNNNDLLDVHKELPSLASEYVKLINT